MLVCDLEKNCCYEIKGFELIINLFDVLDDLEIVVVVEVMGSIIIVWEYIL